MRFARGAGGVRSKMKYVGIVESIAVVCVSRVGLYGVGIVRVL